MSAQLAPPEARRLAAVLEETVVLLPPRRRLASLAFHLLPRRLLRQHEDRFSRMLPDHPSAGVFARRLELAVRSSSQTLPLVRRPHTRPASSPALSSDQWQARRVRQVIDPVEPARRKKVFVGKASEALPWPLSALAPWKGCCNKAFNQHKPVVAHRRLSRTPRERKGRSEDRGPPDAELCFARAGLALFPLLHAFRQSLADMRDKWPSVVSNASAERCALARSKRLAP
ncbi:hypothetical protein BJY59DRAFT_63899 [Rhodotorula toruloides]